MCHVRQEAMPSKDFQFHPLGSYTLQPGLVRVNPSSRVKPLHVTPDPERGVRAHGGLGEIELSVTGGDLISGCV